MKRATIVGLALAVLGTIVPSALATLPGRNGAIFVERDGKGPDLFLIDNQTGVARSLGVPGNPRQASISPNGRWVVYVDVMSSDIYKSKLDGSSRTLLVESRSGFSSLAHPTWSPDGTQIAFDAMWPGSTPTGTMTQRDIFVMDADGSDVTNLLDTDGPDEDPVWSPDGEMIAFISCVVGTACEDDGRILVMTADGSVLILGTEINDGRVAEYEPDWSPDSQKIVFRCVDQRDRLCVLTIESGEIDSIWNSRNQASEPSWSPNGQRIAFVMTPATEEDTDSEIYTIRSDGTDLRRITNNHRDDLTTQWLTR